MNKTIAIALALLVTIAAVTAQPKVSTKQEIAIFALGYYGYKIPIEALATIDVEIQKVFLDLGRFTVIGMDKRFSSNDVNEFVALIKKIKEQNFVLPDKYRFGEEVFTEADFNKLIGAFIIVIPVVTNFNSQYNNSRSQYETNIKTTVTFIEAATGNMIGIADVETSGTSKETQFKSIKNAIDGIPGQLQYEIRKISQFQNQTKVVSSKLGSVTMLLGQNMGVKKGDEYAVIVTENIEGYVNEREVGLIKIKDVGTTSSEGIVLYSDIKLEKDTQLREIPRQEGEASLYAHLVTFDANSTSDSSIAVGLKVSLTRGYFGLMPYGFVQILFDEPKGYPIGFGIGGEYAIYLGRLELAARVGLAGSSCVLITWLQDRFSTSDNTYFTHYGINAGAYLSWLLTRDTKIYASLQYDLMLGLLDGWGEWFNNFSATSIGIGVTFK